MAEYDAVVSNSSSDDEGEARGGPRRIHEPRMEEHLSAFEHKERFRMSRECVDFLENRLGDVLGPVFERRNALSAREKIEISLRCLGSAAFHHYVAEMGKVDKSTVCRVLHSFVDAVNAVLLRELVKWPEGDAEMQAVVDGFQQMAGMNNVFGCVDGMLIRIDAPPIDEQFYVDRKGEHSITCMLVCGPDYKFYYANANWPGSVHDSRVFRTSALCRRLKAGWRPIPNGILVGDSAYALRTYLIPPVARNPNDPTEERFLRSHKSTRRIIENSIGILKEKFPCLNHLRVDPDFPARITHCCVALCNLSRKDVEIAVPPREIVIEENAEQPEENGDDDDDEDERGQREAANAVLVEIINSFR